MNSKLDINAVFLTLKIASISTALTLIAAVLLVWGMENRSKKLRSIVEMLINLSLFISPTVLGYILIIFLGKRERFISISTMLLSFLLLFSMPQTKSTAAINVNAVDIEAIFKVRNTAFISSLLFIYNFKPKFFKNIN